MPAPRSSDWRGVPQAVVAGQTEPERAPVFSPHVLKGGGILATRYGLGVLVSVGNMLVLTWWIGPHAYGLFVTAIGLAAFLSSLARSGVDTYLVRRSEAPDAWMYDVAGTLILMISGAILLLGAALAPLLVRWYGSSEFMAPYLVLLTTVPLTGMTGLPMAKLERELNFGRVAGIELGGQILGLLLSLGLAWSGRGIWAPVAGQIGWQLFVMIAAFAGAGLVPRMRFSFPRAREMLSFGVGITASQRAWQLRTLVNPLLVGRFAGPDGVAFVALAIRIAESLGAFRLAAGRMAIAALARLQGHTDRLRSALEQALKLQVLLLGPLLCSFALLGPLVVHYIIGDRWMPCLAVYPFVAGGVLVNAVYNLQASALFVMGKSWTVLAWYAMHVGLLATGTLILLSRLGISGYGWAELVACAAYWGIHSALAKKVEVRYRSIGLWLAAFLAVLFFPRHWFTWAALLLLGGTVFALRKYVAACKRFCPLHLKDATPDQQAAFTIVETISA